VPLGHFLDLNEVGLHVFISLNMLASRARFSNLEVEKGEREREKYVNSERGRRKGKRQGGRVPLHQEVISVRTPGSAISLGACSTLPILT
jgi:hypothetical protein